MLNKRLKVMKGSEDDVEKRFASRFCREDGRTLGKLVPFSFIDKGSPPLQPTSVGVLGDREVTLEEVMADKNLLSKLVVSRDCNRHLLLLLLAAKLEDVEVQLVHGVSVLSRHEKMVADPHWAICILFENVWFLLNPTADEPLAYKITDWTENSWHSIHVGVFHYTFCAADEEIVRLELEFFGHETVLNQPDFVNSIVLVLTALVNDPRALERISRFCWQVCPMRGAVPRVQVENLAENIVASLQTLPSKRLASKTLEEIGFGLSKMEDMKFPQTFYGVVKCYHRFKAK